MNRLSKTKFIWLAMALVPLLVAVGCGADTQNPPPTNEPPVVEKPTEPAPMPEEPAPMPPEAMAHIPEDHISSRMHLCATKPFENGICCTSFPDESGQCVSSLRLTPGPISVPFTPRARARRCNNENVGFNRITTDDECFFGENARVSANVCDQIETVPNVLFTCIEREDGYQIVSVESELLGRYLQYPR